MLVADFVGQVGPAYQKRIGIIKELEECASREWYSLARLHSKMTWHCYQAARQGDLPGDDKAVLRLGKSGSVVAL